MTSNIDPNALARGSAHIVRVAKIQIDPVHLEAYLTELKDEIQASIRVEPGVISLEAVSTKERPNEITILEVYANAEAYRSHLHSAHFLEYKTATQTMVQSLELIECDPIAFARQ